jgi:rhamnose utilization protein RhaD (predicted bifunctional aldolase and dehydrogenase)
MDKALAELIKISNTVGADSSLVLGEFGNTSVKSADGKGMYIKASGTALKEMSEHYGWRRLRLDSVLAILKDKSLSEMTVEKREAKVAEDLVDACDDGLEAGVRPSVESCFHSILDRFVVHMHPAAVLAYVCAKNGKAELEKLFGEEIFPPVWVAYSNVGYMLAKEIETAVADYKGRYGRRPAVMFLQNHGLVVSSNSSDTTMRLIHKAVDICECNLSQLSGMAGTVETKAVSAKQVAAGVSAICKAFSRVSSEAVEVLHFMDENIARLMANEDGARVCSVPAVSPDELVYCNGPAMWVDKCDEQKIISGLNRRIADGLGIPAAVLIKPIGLFIIGQRRFPLARDVVTAYLSIRSFAARMGGLCPLSEPERKFILNHKNTV